MRKCIYILVRYSVLSLSGWEWKIGKTDLADYKAKLFEPARLRVHEELFFDLTLPSLLAQTVLANPGGVEFRVLVATSDELPEPYKSRLRDALEAHSFASMYELPPISPDFSHPAGHLVQADLSDHGEDALCATVRLDDDDAIASDFAERLATFMEPSHAGFAVSFGSGYALRFTLEGAPEFLGFHQSQTSVGFSYIDHWCAGSWAGPYSNVFSLGPHNRADQFVPVVVDSRAPAFMRAYHTKSDMSLRREDYQVGPKNALRVTPAEVAKRFPIAAVQGRAGMRTFTGK